MRPRVRMAAFLSLVALGLSACAPPLEEGRYGCAEDDGCPEGWVCRADRLCWSTPESSADGGADGGGRDAGPRDAGSEDARVPFDASPDAGEECVPQRSDVDLLILVDKSPSMAEEQEALRTAFPALAALLASGDADGDGARDFPPIASLRVGVITSDLGANGQAWPSCTGMGDDAILLTSSLGGGAGCMAAYPPYVDYEPGQSLSTFTEGVGCVTNVGSTGCGFEQQLDATLKALVPSGSAYLFWDGSLGNGDAENMGFLREESVLVVLELSDEEDCSSHDPERFLQFGGAYDGVDPNQRCYVGGGTELRPSRYVEGLSSLRANPSDLVFGAIVGLPTDAAGRPWDSILADPTMTYDLSGAGVGPVCTGVNGEAAPGRRYVEVARGLEAAGAIALVESICASSFEPFFIRLATAIADRLSERGCP